GGGRPARGASPSRGPRPAVDAFAGACTPRAPGVGRARRNRRRLDRIWGGSGHLGVVGPPADRGRVGGVDAGTPTSPASGLYVAPRVDMRAGRGCVPRICRGTRRGGRPALGGLRPLGRRWPERKTRARVERRSAKADGVVSDELADP